MLDANSGHSGGTGAKGNIVVQMSQERTDQMSVKMLPE